MSIDVQTRLEAFGDQLADNAKGVDGNPKPTPSLEEFLDKKPPTFFPEISERELAEIKRKRDLAVEAIELAYRQMTNPLSPDDISYAYRSAGIPEQEITDEDIENGNTPKHLVMATEAVELRPDEARELIAHAIGNIATEVAVPDHERPAELRDRRTDQAYLNLVKAPSEKATDHFREDKANLVSDKSLAEYLILLSHLEHADPKLKNNPEALQHIAELTQQAIDIYTHIYAQTGDQSTFDKLEALRNSLIGQAKRESPIATDANTAAERLSLRLWEAEMMNNILPEKPAFTDNPSSILASNGPGTSEHLDPENLSLKYWTKDVKAELDEVDSRPPGGRY